jgi:hypothetical protein
MIRMFHGCYPVSGVEVMSTAFQTLTLLCPVGKKEKGEVPTQMGHINFTIHTMGLPQTV